MFCSGESHCRDVFRLGGGFAVALYVPPQSAKAQIQTSGPNSALPARGEFVVSGGHVLTIDTNLGDLPNGDVHVRDGVIVAVGNNLSPPGAEVIDGRDMIVMPGFVETHWHLWCTALRLIVRADDPKEGYFPDHDPGRSPLRTGGLPTSACGLVPPRACCLASPQCTIGRITRCRRSMLTPKFRR